MLMYMIVYESRAKRLFRAGVEVGAAFEFGSNMVL